MIRNIVYDVGYVLVSYTWREDFKGFGYDEAGFRSSFLAARIRKASVHTGRSTICTKSAMRRLRNTATAIFRRIPGH